MGGVNKINEQELVQQVLIKPVENIRKMSGTKIGGPSFKELLEENNKKEKEPEPTANENVPQVHSDIAMYQAYYFLNSLKKDEKK